MGLLTTACSAQVTGYDSPLAHDYGPLTWQPLSSAVEQAFVAGPGYSAAVNNDPHTTPAQFQERLAALPADARDGTLRELRLGLRLRDDDGTAWATGARVQLVAAPELDLRPECDARALYDAAPTLLDVSLDTLARDGEWLRLRDLPDLPDGAVVSLRLVPGDGRDASRLEYGLTTDRTPYGGWPAEQVDGAPLKGALLIQTRYERDIAGWSIVRAGAIRGRAVARSDSVFALAYVAALVAVGVGTLRVWRWRPHAEEA